MKEFKHLSFASSLCGACSEVCPVKINLHEQLLYNRSDSVKEGYASRFDKTMMYAYKTAMGKRKYIDLLNGKYKNKALNKFFAASWGPRRTLPIVAPKSFKELWDEKHGGKK
jgi:L-lactate dehydrogenase complex protein LldF